MAHPMKKRIRKKLRAAAKQIGAPNRAGFVRARWVRDVKLAHADK
jgi:hypothetical protein